MIFVKIRDLHVLSSVDDRPQVVLLTDVPSELLSADAISDFYDLYGLRPHHVQIHRNFAKLAAVICKRDALLFELEQALTQHIKRTVRAYERGGDLADTRETIWQSCKLPDASSSRELSVSSTIELASSTIPTLPDPSLSSPQIRKRKATANTWVHARGPKGSEPARCGPKNEKIYYCKHCTDPSYSTTVSTSFRYHLLTVHRIELETNEHPIKRQCNGLIKDAFAKAGEINTIKRVIQEEETLSAAVNQKAALEALVQLVTVRNLPYNCCAWPELHAFISAVNYTATDF